MEKQHNMFVRSTMFRNCLREENITTFG